MLLENLVRENQVVAYTDGKIFYRGNNPDSKLTSKMPCHFSSPIDFMDLKNQREGNYTSLQTCISRVILPYLNASCNDRKSQLEKLFPYLKPGEAAVFTNKYCSIFKPSRQRPMLQLEKKTYQLKKQIPLKAAASAYSKENVYKKKQSNHFHAITHKRHSTIVNKIPRFVMENERKERFAFTNIELCLDIRHEGRRFTFSHIYDKNTTSHPFIYSSGRVCTSDEEFVDDLKISKSHTVLSNAFIQDVCSFYLHSRSILFKGYQKNVRPVSNLTISNYKREYIGGGK